MSARLFQRACGLGSSLLPIQAVMRTGVQKDTTCSGNRHTRQFVYSVSYCQSPSEPALPILEVGPQYPFCLVEVGQRISALRTRISYSR